MAKTNNNSLKLQRAVRSLFYDYQEKKGCLGTTYAQAACGCDNALQMWRGPKGEKGDPGPQGPKGDNAGSFLVSAEFVVNPAGQPEGSYLKLVLIDVAQQEQVVYVNLSELEDVYSAGNGIDITSMVIAAKLGAGLTFDQQGNITSAYQFCDGLDETSNVVKVKLDASNNILGFAGSGCKGLTATVGLAQSSSGVNLVLTGASGAVLSTIPLEGGTGITVQKNAQTGGFTWLVDFSDVISSTAGNNLTISDNKLYVGNSALSYTVGDGTFTLTNAAGGTSTVTLPTVVRSLDRADLVCEGENAPYLRLTFKRDNGQNLYQDVSLACLASALDVISNVSLDAQCGEIVTPSQSIPYENPWAWTDLRFGISIDGTNIRVPQGGWIVDNVEEVPSFDVDLSSANITENSTVYIRIIISPSNNSDFSNWYELATSSFADLLAAGASGVPMEETYCEDYPGIIDCVEVDGKKMYISCIAKGSDIYTFYPFVVIPETTQTGLTADLVIENAAGTETRVDMKPLLGYVGGTVVGVPIITPAVFTREVERSPDTGFTGSIDFYYFERDMCYYQNRMYTVSELHEDGTLTLYRRSDDPRPDYFDVNVYEVAHSAAVDNITYRTHYDRTECVATDNNIAVDDLLSTGVVIRGYDNNDQPVDSAIYLKGETVEGTNVFDGEDTTPGILLRVYRYNGSEKVLRLGPSCSSDIPLADLGGISGAALDIDGCLPPSFACEGVTSVVPEGEPILFRVELQYLTQQRYNDVVAGRRESSVDGTTTISTNHGEATVTTGDMSSYYAVCIQAAVQDCCFIYNDSRIDSYVSPNTAGVPSTIWESPSYPIPISALLSAGAEGIELSLLSHYNTEPAYGTDKLIVIATANQDGSLTFSFKIRKPAITGCFIVPGLPEPYTANPGIVLSGAISVNGTFILGQAHTGNNFMEEIQGFSTELNSFTVTNSTGSDGPVAITLLLDGVRSDDFWDYFRLSVPSWSAFVAAGEAGLPMEEDCGSCGYYYEGDDYSPVCIKFFGKKMYLSCMDEGNNVYRLYPFVMPQYTEVVPEEPEGLKADLVLTDTGGNETRVDMKPLLAHIGGEIKDIPVSIEPVPLYTSIDASSPAGYLVEWMATASTVNGIWSGGVDVFAVSTSDANGAVDVCFDGTPVYIDFCVTLRDELGNFVDDFKYLTIVDDSDYGLETGIVSPYMVLDTYLAAGPDGVLLRKVVWDSTLNAYKEFESDLRLVITELAGENCYRFSLRKVTLAPRLCLEPSCDPCIDLTPAIGDALTNVSGSVSCSTLVPYDHEQVTHAECKDANGNNILTGVTLTQTTGTNQYTVTFPSNAAKLLLMYTEVFGMNTNSPIYCRENTGFVDLSSIHVGDRFCVVPICTPLLD